MKMMFAVFFHIIVFVILTMITQIGGCVYLISLLFWKRSNITKIAIFLLLYLIATFLIVPQIAPMFGRVKITNSDHIQPTNILTILLNRNYVHPRLNTLLHEIDVSIAQENKDIHVMYLDANFPFINGFPLLPHLSHNDGKKLDISFLYELPTGGISNKKKSRSGYGVFSEPGPTEYHQSNICKRKNSYYDYSKYFSLGKINTELKFSTRANKELINMILSFPSIEKVFVEKHLKYRMGLKDSRIRFQGCHSVRHDDHIHIQIK